MINGIINIYKVSGFTSHDVVAKMRGMLRQRKIGHTGTLDPDAEGVLPVCLGSATKLCDLLTEKDKEYRAVLLLGRTTDTQDIGGKIIEEREPVGDEALLRSVIRSFEGEYMQLPPMYSALKVGGKKLVDLAREGKEIRRERRKVHIFSVQIEKIAFPRVELSVCCSKGTYIRTLCHDIGEKLGCGGCMEKLTRTRSGRFRMEDAIRLADLEKMSAEDIEGALLRPEDYFSEFEALFLREEYDKYGLNGNKLKPGFLQAKIMQKDGDSFRIYDSKRNFLGIYRYFSEEDLLKPVKLFL
ncbi:MAG: tRNA pseudouridine(55) synthase TruB [Johnsonella sp.]|nr:tRNA pseudouridine(55) synthase TruB [Johnsonella sp.]